MDTKVIIRHKSKLDNAEIFQKNLEKEIDFYVQ